MWVCAYIICECLYNVCVCVCVQYVDVLGGIHSIMVTTVRKGHNNTSSDLWQDCLHFT